MRMMKRFIHLFLSVKFCQAILYHNIEEIPRSTFDFIVIGGGTAGNVVANRLTENPSTSVLVLEAGPSNEGVLDSIVPFFIRSLLDPSPYNWNYSTVSQEGLNGRVIPFARGHILGGSSSINAMYYTRGSAEDYDRYARITGDPGWSWQNLQFYIRKSEMWSLPVDRHNITGQFNPAVHGFHGINAVSLSGFPLPTEEKVIQTTKELPKDFPFNLDMNSGKPLGLGWLQATIKDGKRSSSATPYMGPQFINRRNLHVVVNARVTKLLRRNQDQSTLTFKGVEVIHENNDLSGKRQVFASKEVILAAGAVGTPHILLNSGIGNRDELEQVGIQTIHHLPSVGKNASDHPVTRLRWSVNSTDTLDILGYNATAFNSAFQLWNKTGKGPLGLSGFPTTHIAWSRLADPFQVFQNSSDPTAGPTTPHIELAIESNGGADRVLPTSGNFLIIAIVALTPSSRGSVTLQSNDPLVAPLIDPGLLREKSDLVILREGIKLAKKFISAPVWRGYVLDLLAPFANVTADEDIDQVNRANAGTENHFVGTAAMSPYGADYGVVNPDLRVKGVDNLRIVDASVLPFIPSAHPQAATYIFAERASDLIKSRWN